jgi:hypothetical protein
MNLAHNVFLRVYEYATKSIVELRTALFSVVTQVVAIPYRRFGTSYKSHRQEWVFFVSWPLKMRPSDCPESSVRNYHHPLHKNPEKRCSHLLSGGNLKSRLLNFYRRLEVDALVFLYTEYKAASSSETSVSVYQSTRCSHPSDSTVRTSNLANCDIPFFV